MIGVDSRNTCDVHQDTSGTPSGTDAGTSPVGQEGLRPPHLSGAGPPPIKYAVGTGHRLQSTTVQRRFTQPSLQHSRHLQGRADTSLQQHRSAVLSLINVRFAVTVLISEV